MLHSPPPPPPFTTFTHSYHVLLVLKISLQSTSCTYQILCQIPYIPDLCTQTNHVYPAGLIAMAIRAISLLQRISLDMAANPCKCTPCVCLCMCVCAGLSTFIVYLAISLCCATRCGCMQQTAHSEAMFNTAARSSQSVPQTGPLEAIEEWSSQQRTGGGLERERSNQSPALPRSQFTYFLQSERHYLGQDDRKSTTNA